MPGLLRMSKWEVEVDNWSYSLSGAVYHLDTSIERIVGRKCSRS